MFGALGKLHLTLILASYNVLLTGVGLRLDISTVRALQLDKSLVTFGLTIEMFYGGCVEEIEVSSFIANREREIQDLSEPKQLRHVSTVMNPADPPKWGASAKDLKSKTLWWEGPELLKHNGEVRLETKIDPNLEATKEDKKIHMKNNSKDGAMLLAIGPES